MLIVGRELFKQTKGEYTLAKSGLVLPGATEMKGHLLSDGSNPVFLDLDLKYGSRLEQAGLVSGRG